jgi:hypothetical protein
MHYCSLSNRSVFSNQARLTIVLRSRPILRNNFYFLGDFVKECSYFKKRCRIIFANPYNEWKDNGDFLNMSHSKMSNLTKDYLNHLNTDYALKVEKSLNELKRARELFSYKFPSIGLGIINEYDIEEIIEICSTICELAQLTSEQLQRYIY